MLLFDTNSHISVSLLVLHRLFHTNELIKIPNCHFKLKVQVEAELGFNIINDHGSLIDFRIKLLFERNLWFFLLDFNFDWPKFTFWLLKRIIITYYES